MKDSFETSKEPLGSPRSSSTAKLFCTYSETNDAFMGTLKAFDHTQIYMVYTKNGNILRIGGDPLEQKDMHITLRGDGQWNPLPCLLSQPTPLTEALADYYDYASAGDLIKAHDRFAYFSADKKWVGDLTALRPGEGYLFRRMGADTVTINFFNKPSQVESRKTAPLKEESRFSKAATNMTMICRVSGLVDERVSGLAVYIGDELVGVAEPIIVDDQPLYFLTIQSDLPGELRFETADGQRLTATVNCQLSIVNYQPDAHHGTLKAPVRLRPADDNRPYKIIENDHVIIIRNNEKYDITGQKL